MKQSDKLKKIIRKIVKEEVGKAVKEVITEMKQQSISSNNPVKPKKYTSNRILNDILNETKGGVPQGKEDYPKMSGETYTTDKMSDILNKSYDGTMNDDQMVASTGANPEAVPNHINDALTKDYSKLMNTIINKDKE